MKLLLISMNKPIKCCSKKNHLHIMINIKKYTNETEN